MKVSIIIVSVLIISFSVIITHQAPLNNENTNSTDNNDSRKCNGYSEFCNRNYSSITFVGTHNSYASGSQAAANQVFDIPTQLKDGVRAFSLDGHYKNATDKTLEICHTSCGLLDAYSIVEGLKNFTTFLENNPNEVITIFWENFDKITASEYKDAYDQADLTKYAYTPESTTEWPTLSSLIDSDKRLINFIDTGYDSKFEYVFETPFEVSSPDSFTCTIDRPKGGLQRPMYLINHFVHNTVVIGGSDVEVAQISTANTTNSNNLKDHIEKCQTTFSRIPNFVLVDFYDKGIIDENGNNVNVFSVVADINNVTYVYKELGNDNNSSDKPKKNGGSRISDKLISKNSMFALSVIIVFVIFGF
ncbi:7027_t:CDS:2 [Diversispora eburnea]|uniref:7027_t:CDS:1 n=1 Tax=Diversispora eburnea TaxID=1213867 RepID=A0A9N9BZN5_9GLOM|nr:7027_t:CDS:2 [Diversispora eburnea]